jgi:predicted Zn-ribbon and HTH transcriptional regulator
MSVKEQVLDIIKASASPLTAGEVEKLSGLARKDVDKAFTELKKENAIVSPVRCKWEAAVK